MLAGSWELQVVLMSALWSSRHIKVVVHDGPCERHVEHMLLLAWRVPLARVFLDSILRHVRTGGVVIDIAERWRAGLVEPLFHPREVAHACRMR